MRLGLLTEGEKAGPERERETRTCNGLENLLGDSGSRLVLGQGVRVVEGVV